MYKLNLICFCYFIYVTWRLQRLKTIVKGRLVSFSSNSLASVVPPMRAEEGHEKKYPN